MLVGALQIWAYRDGLLEWWRIVNLSYAEVSKTEYMPIWTSGRGVIGAIFVISGIFWICAALREKRQNNKGCCGGEGRTSVRAHG